MDFNASSLDREPDNARQTGHGYSGIVIQDDAKAHLGNTIYHNAVVHVACEHFRSSSSTQLTSETTAQISTAATHRSSMKRKRYELNVEEVPRQNQQHALGKALERLGEFSTSIQHQKLDKDARKVARHVRTLVDAIRTDGSSSEHTKKEWKMFKNSVTVAECVVINAVSPRTARTNVVKIDRKKDVIRFGPWQISLTTLIFHLRDALGRERTETDSTIRIEPSSLRVGPSIAVVVGERTDCFSKSFLNPTIFAYRIVRSDSPVFALIEEDDVDGLLRLLATQKATTRDCDEENRSLLFVSDRSSATRMKLKLVSTPATIVALDVANSWSKKAPTWTGILSDFQKMSTYQCLIKQNSMEGRGIHTVYMLREGKERVCV